MAAATQDGVTHPVAVLIKSALLFRGLGDGAVKDETVEPQACSHAARCPVQAAVAPWQALKSCQL